MRGVLTGFTTIWSLTLIGYLIGRFNLLGTEATRVVARLVFLVCAPALLFTTLARADLTRVFTPALAAFAVSTVITAAGYLVLAGRRNRVDRATATIGALSASYVNTANLGLPVAAYVLGDVSVIAPMLLFQVLLVTPVALAILDRGTGGRTSWRQLAGLPARNPVILGCAGGLLVAATGWQPAAEVLRPFELLGAAAVPLALLALGMSLPGARPLSGGDDARQRYLAVALKVVGQPAVSYVIGRYALGLDRPALLTAVVGAALPTAQNVFVYATQYGRATALARDAVVLSTVVAAISLTVITLWLG